MENDDDLPEEELNSDLCETDSNKRIINLDGDTFIFMFYKTDNNNTTNYKNTETEKIFSWLLSSDKNGIRRVTINRIRNFYEDNKSVLVYDGYTFKRKNYLLLKRQVLSNFFDELIETSRTGENITEFFKKEFENDIKQKIKNNYNRKIYVTVSNDENKINVLDLSIESFQFCMYISMYMEEMK